jgi:hypothetical protein
MDANDLAAISGSVGGHEGPVFGRAKSVVRRVVLRCHLSPGDVLMLTAAVRDLHVAYPGLFETDVRSSCGSLWDASPWITSIDEHSSGVEIIDCEYPLIHRSNELPYHFIHGYRKFLAERLDLRIPITAFRGDVHLRAEEKMWMSQVEEEFGYAGKFWLVVSGGKYDFTTKWWGWERYQRVVDLLAGRIQFVQIGESQHFHPRLKNTLDLRGRTDLRQLIRLMYHADGVICPVTFLMHLAAAVESKYDRLRPAIVIAGGRKAPHWEAYPGHQFLHTIGALSCCRVGGCWRARVVPLNDDSDLDVRERLCVDVWRGVPRCMDMIVPERVADLALMYAM